MIKVRNSVFETNSSMMHSLVLLSDSDYNKLENEDFYYDERHDQLLSKEEAKEYIRKIYRKYNLPYPESEEEIKEAFEDEYIYPIEHYTYNDDFECFHVEKIINGETVHAVGYYGYD